MTRMTQAPFWKFPQPFHFETKASLHDIVHELACLEEKAHSSIRYPVTVAPLEDGYSFQHAVETRSKRQPNWHPQAVANGEVWSDGMGSTTITGVAEIDSAIYISLLIPFVILVVAEWHWVGHPSLLSIGMIIISLIAIYNTCGRRHELVERISEAVGRASRGSSEKTKWSDRNTSESPAHIDVVIQPDSVWNNAISEYEKVQEEAS